MITKGKLMIEIDHLIMGLQSPTISTYGEEVHTWASQFLLSSIPGKTKVCFLLGEKRGYGAISPNHIIVIMRVPGLPPVMVLLSFNNDGDLLLCVINDKEISLEDEDKQEIVAARTSLLRLRDAAMKSSDSDTPSEPT